MVIAGNVREKEELDSVTSAIGSIDRIIRVQIGDDLRQINLDSTGDLERLINYLVKSIEECRTAIRAVTDRH